VRDDHREMGMPAMQEHQQLDFATATMKRPKPVPFKRIKLSSDQSSSSSIGEPSTSKNSVLSESQESDDVIIIFDNAKKSNDSDEKTEKIAADEKLNASIASDDAG